MDPHNFRRGRSPPFGYNQPRPPMDDYDNPPNYHPMESYDGPPHQMGMLPMPPIQPHMQPQPYMEGPPHHDYPPDYREHHRVHASSRLPMPLRDPYVPSPASHPPRASSPPYKILCITNINHKVSDGPVKEALTGEFGRFGDISVTICHDSGERLAYIYFRSYEEAREARNTRIGTMLFDRPIEIEPIYEPSRTEPAGLPPSPAGAMMAPGQPMYPSRRRSISPPPPSYPQEINGLATHRRLPPSRTHLPYGPPVNHPGYAYHRGSPPSDYAHQPPPASYAYGPPLTHSMAPGQPSPYERRGYDDGGYNHYPSPHAVNATSPYSTPPHDHYRSPYGPQVVPGPTRSERDKIPLPDPRSPRGEAYHHMDQRGLVPGLAPQDHHPPPPRPFHGRSGRRSGRSRAERRRKQSPLDAPMRFMSREYRREKFGGDHGPGELEDGKPSRVLLVNNIDPTKTETDLRETFEPYGLIEEMEVKKVGPDTSSAIIRFSSMDGAYKAKTANNGRAIGTLRCRIVYGKVSASRKLWIGGLSPSTTVTSLENECSKYGYIACMEYAPGRPYCYIEFESANQAQFAAHHLKSTLMPASERKIRVEFVDLDRSDRLPPRGDSSSHASEPKSRIPTETAHELESSPLSTINTSGSKRGASPGSDTSKRVCPATDLPMGSNTFKQERLAAAAAAAKARSSSTASSQQSDRFDVNKTPGAPSDSGHELNNNGEEIQTNNGNLDTSQTPNAYDQGSLVQAAPCLERLSQCTSIREVLSCCPVSWPSRLALKNTLFPAQMYLCSGSKALIDTYLSRAGEDVDPQCPVLSITQRWRLHPQPKLEVVKRRMQSGNLGILIITSRQENQTPSTSIKNMSDQMALNAAGNASIGPNQNGKLHATPTGEHTETPDTAERTSTSAAESRDESMSATRASLNNSEARPNQTPTPCPATQSKSIRNLISYLGQKDAAGVISLSASDGATDLPHNLADNPPKLLYTFPPGEFALNLLRRMASNLAPEAAKEEFLLGVISRGNLEGKI